MGNIRTYLERTTTGIGILLLGGIVIYLSKQSEINNLNQRHAEELDSLKNASRPINIFTNESDRAGSIKVITKSGEEYFFAKQGGNFSLMSREEYFSRMEDQHLEFIDSLLSDKYGIKPTVSKN